jgi:predicted nucleotidyltransferase
MVESLVARLARAIEDAGLPYMVIGGMAVLVYGEPRLTKDIDITLGVDGDALPQVLRMAERLDLQVLVDDPEQFISSTMVLPLLDAITGLRVDMMFSWSPYERQAIQRARRVEMGGAKVSVASLEDLVIHKVIAGRPRDLDDVVNVLLKNPGYDRQYVMDWLERFDAALGSSYVATFGRLEKELE